MHGTLIAGTNRFLLARRSCCKVKWLPEQHTKHSIPYLKDIRQWSDPSVDNCRIEGTLTLLTQASVRQDFPLMKTGWLMRALRLSPLRESSMSNLTVAVMRLLDSPEIIQIGPCTMLACESSPDVVIWAHKVSSETTWPLASNWGTANHFMEETIGHSIKRVLSTWAPRKAASTAWVANLSCWSRGC